MSYLLRGCFEVAVALKIGDVCLGVMGEDGWEAVSRSFAEEKGHSDFFVSLACEFLQRSDQPLQWRESEQEEVEAEIQETVCKIRAGLSAQTLDMQTQLPSQLPSPVRQLKTRL